MTSIATVHILDRFVPELQRYLLIDEIGCYLIAEGLLSNEDYLTLVNHTPKRVAVVELLQIVKRKGPDSLQRFLYALDRSCTEPPTPHEGHNHLYELIQEGISSAHMHSLKKKSKSPWSLFKRNKHSKSNKDVSSLLLSSTPNNTLANHPSSSGATRATLNLQSRYSIISSGTSGGSDEDNNRNSMYDSTSSQDSYNPPELPPSQPPPSSTGLAQPNTTDQHVIEELQKENKKLKNNLSKKAEQLEKYKATVKEQSLRIEDLKADKEKYKSKMQALEVKHLTLQVETNERDSLREELEHQVEELEHQVRVLQLQIKKVTQEKEYLKKSSTYGHSSYYQSRRTQSLNYRTPESSLFTSSTSLSSIHETKIEELKSAVNKNDEALHSKLGELAEMSEGVREPSRLNRKWHSDIKLVQHRYHYKENNFPFLLSQT